MSDVDNFATARPLSTSRDVGCEASLANELTDQDESRPQLSLKSNNEEILREVCLNNGINFKKLKSEGPRVTVLEMFFSGFPRLTGLKHFKRLTTLTVIGQSISQMEGLSVLTSLKELWIAECQLTKIEGLDNCKALQKVYLYGNKIEVIENIDHLENISVLWLNNNCIKNIENISNLTNLKELNIAENLIEKIGTSLSANTQLTELNLSGNPLWSLRDLTNLVRLTKLKHLSLRDPLYQACPLSQLCNYATHLMYHLPGLTTLDTLDTSSKHLLDLAENIVNKKKMFYNMRSKTIKRNLACILNNLETSKKELLEKPSNKIRVINFVIKEMERSENVTKEKSNDFEYDSDPECERAINPKDRLTKASRFETKLEALRTKRRQWEQRMKETEGFACLYKERMVSMADMMINRLLMELETGGNVRFEEGQSNDAWFSSCHDLVLSRFCAYDYKDLGVMGIKINRIVRIHNRMLRIRFDKSIVQSTEGNREEYYPEIKNTSYKKLLEYLFWMPDPEIAHINNEAARISEEGFLDSETCLKLGRDGAVSLSNSISLADRRRISHSIMSTKDTETFDKCPFRYGQLIVAKAYLGKSVVAKDTLLITKENYPKMDSVFKPRKKCVPKQTKVEDNGCECSARQCEWYIFDNNLVLPEYIIEFEYVTQKKSRCPFQSMNEDLLSEQPTKPFKFSLVKPKDDDMDSDTEIIKMEPEVKPRPRIVALTDELILKTAKINSLNKISSLNLHGNGLTRLKPLQALPHLVKLVVSFNELARLDDLSNMKIEFLDVSFNKIQTLDGAKGLAYLQTMNISWNKLMNTREELSILRKYFSSLRSLNISNNPWIKPKNLRIRTVSRLKNLVSLNGQLVTDTESALALRCAAGARISQVSLLTNSRTDSVIPRSLSLGDSVHILTSISRNKPSKISDNDSSWFQKITSLHLEGQHLSKISNLEHLENLKWASFNNNDLTRIEGLDACQNLLELSLSDNCITDLIGVPELTNLVKLDLSHNCIASIDQQVLSCLQSLASLSLDSNEISSLAGLQKSTSLVELYIANNNISNIREVFALKPIPNLVILDMFGNPLMTEVENYRLFIIYHLRSLKALDGLAIAPQTMRREIAAYQKTQAALDLLILDINNSAQQVTSSGLSTRSRRQ